ncbi:hypothetical protein ACHQM5_020208 [Ranunculus cassubicifolius]
MSEDLVFSILLWLPVMSLLRFKSVCKLWRDIIESSTFIYQHLHHHNTKKNGNGKIIHRHCSPSTGDYQGKYLSLSGDNFDVSINLDFDQHHWYPPYQLSLLHSCNGIICLTNLSTREVALWNPATRKFRRLVESPIPRQHFVSAAFGFDVKSMDYKVVRIILFDYNILDNQVEVYSLATDSWRIIHRNIVFPVTAFRGRDPKNPRIVWKGKCFWFGSGPRPDMLLSFDLGDEVFGSMPLPENYKCNSPGFTSSFLLDSLHDKLALITVIADPSVILPYNFPHIPPYEFHNANCHFEIWVLQEYGVKESWVKLYTIGPLDYLLPARFSKNEEFLFFTKYTPEDIDGKLCLYNLFTQEVKILSAEEAYWREVEFIPYDESLVSINGGNCAANRTSCSV